MPSQLRVLFVNLLLNCNVLNLNDLWEKFKNNLSEDYMMKKDPFAFEKSYFDMSELFYKNNTSIKKYLNLKMNINCVDYQSAVEVIFSVAEEKVCNFALLKVAVKNVTVYGQVNRLPIQDEDLWVVMLKDSNNNLLECQLNDYLDVKLTYYCCLNGDLIKSCSFFLILKTHPYSIFIKNLRFTFLNQKNS